MYCFNVVSCPEGLTKMYEVYPKVKVITLAIDEKLNEDKYIVPGTDGFSHFIYTQYANTSA